jgi:hypothetical protein
MKTLLKFCLPFFILFIFAGCRSIEFDPAKGIFIQMDLQFQIIDSKASQAGVTFEKTYSLNLRDTFAKRYNIDPAKLDSIYVNYLDIGFNQDRCNDLQDYEIRTTFPSIGNLAIGKSILGCDLTTISGKSTILTLRKGVTWPDPILNFYAKQLVKTNYAPAIKSAEPWDITFKMTPKVNFDKAMGVSIELSTRAYYKP